MLQRGSSEQIWAVVGVQLKTQLKNRQQHLDELIAAEEYKVPNITGHFCCALRRRFGVQLETQLKNRQQYLDELFAAELRICRTYASQRQI